MEAFIHTPEGELKSANPFQVGARVRHRAASSRGEEILGTIVEVSTESYLGICIVWDRTAPRVDKGYDKYKDPLEVVDVG